MTFPVKLVKTAMCHQNMLKRPVIVPILQNRSRKSPLDFLGFPFLPAFSHKELMGYFGPYSVLYCQNDEVSTVVHTPVHAKSAGTGTVRYPLGRTPANSSSDLCNCALSAVFSTNQYLLGN